MYRNVNKYGVLLILVAILFLFALNLSASAKITIKFAHAAGPDPYNSIEQAWLSVFKSVLEAETNGEIEVAVYPSEQLGDMRQIAEGVQLGTIQMGAVTDAILGLFYPKAAIFSIPYAFNESEDIVKFWNTDFAQKWADDCAQETGIKVFDVATFGFRNFINNIRPIKTPDDMKGLKIRVMQSPIYLEMMKSLGAIPTPMAVGELYSAAQTGVVDGLENPFSVILLHSFQEVQKYLTNMGYVAGVQPMIINEKFYNSLSNEHKEAMEKARHIASQAGLGWCYIANYGVGLAKLSQEMEVYTPNEEERALFKAIIQPAGLKIIADTVGEDYLNEALKVINSL